jgi:hypothetical protein
LLLELLLEGMPRKSGKAHLASHRKATNHIPLLLCLNAFQADRYWTGWCFTSANRKTLKPLAVYLLFTEFR